MTPRAGSTIRRFHRAGLAASLSSLLAAVACQVTAPAPPDAPPPPASTATAAALAGSSPVLPPSSPAASSAAHRGVPVPRWMFDADAPTRIAPRAWLGGLSMLRVHPQDTETLRDGKPEGYQAMEVPVVEVREEQARILFEGHHVRVLLWTRREAFERVPLQHTRLALQPGVHPRGPEGWAENDRVGVWVRAGWYARPRSTREGWREVEVRDTFLEARGWLEEAQLGDVYTPRPHPDRSQVSTGVLRAGTELQASAQGPVIARVSTPEGATSGWLHLDDDLGVAPRGFRFVRHDGRESWVFGLIPLSDYQPPGNRSGGHRATHSARIRLGNPLPLALMLAAGTELLDRPGGEVVGRASDDLPIPDRIARQTEQGLRRVEVPLREAGTGLFWVDERSLRALPRPAAASASASDSSPPGGARP